jgi:hypothetical protein
MKSRIVKTEPTPPEIDWSKPQLVESKERVVATTGKHSKLSFEGMVIVERMACPVYPILDFSDKWDKGSFTPCKLPLTVTFEND